MEILIVLAVAFGTNLAWICFLSWVVTRFAYHDALPAQRAALTASTALLLAVASSLLTIFVFPTRCRSCQPTRPGP
jgi:uncharacterized protein (DUF486 family)